MNKRTLRRLLKWSYPLNIAFFVLALLDYVYWDSVAMIPILAIYALLVLGIIVVLVIDESPHYQRLEFTAPDEGPRTIIYGRR